MSGGSLGDFRYYQLNMIADEIESTFINDGKYEVEDWSASSDYYGNRPMKTEDIFNGATPEEKIKILAETKYLISILQNTSSRLKELDYFLSGDTGSTSYLERLKEFI